LGLCRFWRLCFLTVFFGIIRYKSPHVSHTSSGVKCTDLFIKPKTVNGV
jgi:hypothetical protein